MSWDIKLLGSNTFIKPTDSNYSSNNDFRWGRFIGASGYLTSFYVLVEDAIDFVKDNCDEDYTWDTWIYSYEELMNKSDSNNPLLKMIKDTVLENEKTKYIFLQLF